MFTYHIRLKTGRCIIIWLAGIMGLFGFALQSNGWAQDPSASQWKIPDVMPMYFAPAKANPSLRMDFAELEYQHPLTLAQRLSLTPEILENLSQEHLDQLYARLTAGPLPDGQFQGKAFLPQHHREHLTRVWQVLGVVVSPQTKNIYQGLQGRWMELWQGKEFDRQNKFLQNRVDLKLLNDIAPLLGERFAHALHTLPENPLLFPAKMYCGQSKLDSRRESIILDYAYNGDFPQSCAGLQSCKEINKLVSRKGLDIRDEIRMIHPGLYLGRVYLGKFFLINFTVMNAKLTDAWKDQVTKGGNFPPSKRNFQEDCWTGTPYHQ